MPYKTLTSADAVCAMLAYDAGLIKAARKERITVVDGRELETEKMISELQQAGKYVIPPF